MDGADYEKVHDAVQALCQALDATDVPSGEGTIALVRLLAIHIATVAYENGDGNFELLLDSVVRLLKDTTRETFEQMMLEGPPRE